MNLNIIFFLTTLPAVVCILFYLFKKEEMELILRKHDTGYIPNGFLDYMKRVFKTYKIRASLERREKRLLAFSMISIVIAYISLIIWALLISLFPDYVFGD